MELQRIDNYNALTLTIALAVLAEFSLTAFGCSREISSRYGIFYSFLDSPYTKSPSIAELKKHHVDRDQDCIISMDINWDDDVTLQFSSFSSIQYQYPPIIRIIRSAHDQNQVQPMEDIEINGLKRIVMSGDITPNVAIIYSKRLAMRSPFVLVYTVKKRRDLTCPDLENHFSSVACSGGKSLGSNCTFLCPNGYYPSPDLYNTYTKSEILNTFQSSSNGAFFSTCSLSERRRPSWKPDLLTRERSKFGVEWPDVNYYWKCVDLEFVRFVCLQPGSLSSLTMMIYHGLKSSHVYEYIAPKDCYYPQAYLLSIFDEESDNNFVMETKIPVGADGFSGMSGTQNQAIEDGRLDCGNYCKYSTANQAHLPKCGNFATAHEQIECLTCRYTGSSCAQNDVI